MEINRVIWITNLTRLPHWMKNKDQKMDFKMGDLLTQVQFRQLKVCRVGEDAAEKGQITVNIGKVTGRKQHGGYKFKSLW